MTRCGLSMGEPFKAPCRICPHGCAAGAHGTLVDMLVATQAGMLRKAENSLIRADLARAGQFKEALARGEVTPELEKLLGESIGIGRVPTGPVAEIGTEVDAGGAINNPAPAGLARLLGSFSVGEDDGGSRRRDEFVHKVWSALAKHDELFQYGRTTSKDAAEIAKAVSRPGREVTVEDEGDQITFNGYRGFIRIYEADTDRPYIWSPYAESQGEKEGGGAQLYAAALDWIHNNGKRIKDDWRGLSDINAKRRTSNFLASAMRWGTTKHLEPHAKQGIGAWTGDEVADFAALARKEMENVFEAIPEARGWTFDFKAGSFRDADGRPLARDEIEAAIARGEPGRSGVGLSTLRRGMLTASAIQARHGGSATDAVESLVPEVLPAALRRVSYSLGPVEPERLSSLRSGDPLRIPLRTLTPQEAKAVYKQLNTSTAPDGRKVDWVNSMFGKLARHSNRDELFAVIPSFGEILESSVTLYSEGERNPEQHPNIKGFNNYGRKVVIGEKEYYVRITTQMPKGKTNDQFHNAFVSDVQMVETAAFQHPSSISKLTIEERRGLDTKLAQWISTVNIAAEDEMKKPGEK
jgi:hypothetical protein